jgi:hypothetical protein
LPSANLLAVTTHGKPVFRDRRMRIEQLVGIGLFTVALVLTMYTWRDRLAIGKRVEGFAVTTDLMDDSTFKMVTKANETTPTDQEAIEAHQTLLRYMRDNFGQGIKFARDFGDKFFGNNLPFREDLDVRTLLDNYQSPLQRL